MVSTKVTSALMGAVYASSVAAFGSSDNMGPAAIMWPADRPWSDKHDNSAPCGSDAAVGERTPFPIRNGRLALVTQDDVRAVHISVSYENDPQDMDDFETFFGPNEVGSLSLGHTCIQVPDAPSNIRAGDNATFSMLYVANFAENEADRTVHYACSDVTFVEFESFDEAIPCFNTTIDDPDIKVDDTFDITTTDKDGNQPHTVEDFTNTSSSSGSSMGAGEIAGAVVGAVAGLGLIGAAVFFWRRRSQKKEEEQKQMRQIDAEKANSDTLSTRS